MEERVDRAIILRVHPLRESDVLLHVLGASIGRRSVTAKGAKTSRKRFGGALQPFTLVELERRKSPHGGLDTLTGAVVEHGFPGIRTDLARIALASHFCELCDVFLPEGEPAPDAFELLLLLLSRLNEADPTLKHWLIFLSRLLVLTGLRPRFTQCEETGLPLTDGAFVDARSGEILSQTAALGRRGMIALDTSCLRVLEDLFEAQLAEIGAVRIGREQARPLVRTCLCLLRRHQETPLKTLTLVEAHLVPEGL